MTLQLRIAAHSEVGPVRKMNQDSGYASSNLLVVADGMGGAAAGDLASAVAIEAIRKVDAPTTGEQMLEILAGALHKANDRIADLVDADYALEGMGTTVTGALFDGSQFGLAHIGDSRAYLLHDSHLERLTHDHSWVQSLIDDGKINEQEAAIHPHRSLLLRVLNGQPANEPDLTMVKVVAGDRLLFCSDGLCGLVDDPVIERALKLPNLNSAMKRLVDEALAEGGIDNITVILADVVESEPTEDVFVLGAAADRVIPAVETRSTDTLTGTDDLIADDEEDTLVRPDPAAAVLIAAPPGGPEDEARYNPQPPRKRRFIRVAIGLVALLLIVGAGLGSAYAWTRTQYYVGASSEHVAIFQGISDGLPGIRLSRLYEIQPLEVRALPAYYQEKVRATMEVSSLTAARQTVNELTATARRCAAPRLPAKPSPSVSARPGTPRPTVTTGSPNAAPSKPSASTPRPSPSTSPATATAKPSAAPSSATTATPEPNC